MAILIAQLFTLPKVCKEIFKDFFNSIKHNNFCIEHLDMAGLVTILKEEAYMLDRFSFS